MTIYNVVYCRKHILCVQCPFKLVFRGRIPTTPCINGFIRKNQ
jgi:hypothetical protein